MKIINNRLSLRNGLKWAPLLVGALFFVSSSALASKWEVAIVFSGQFEGSNYQTDIDENIKEILSIDVHPELKISVLRELNGQALQWVSTGADDISSGQ